MVGGKDAGVVVSVVDSFFLLPKMLSSARLSLRLSPRRSVRPHHFHPLASVSRQFLPTSTRLPVQLHSRILSTLVSSPTFVWQNLLTYNLSQPPPPEARENIYTIPNALTLSRIIACPVIGYYVLSGELGKATALLFVAGVTDLVRQLGRRGGGGS